jgi:hypothetical protein
LRAIKQKNQGIAHTFCDRSLRRQEIGARFPP